MKSINVIIIALLLIPVMGMAQQAQTPEETAKKQTEWMQKNLQLNEDQLEDVQEINTEYAEKKQEIYTSDDSKQDKLNDLMAEREEYTEEIREVLTDAQFVKFQQMEKNWFEKDKGKISDTEE